MPRTDYRFFNRMRVRWAEADMQGIVFNGHYLTYFDVSITEYWRAIGLRYPEEVVHEWGVDTFVVKSTIEYHGSARFDDEIDVGVRCARIGRSSMQFLLEIHRGDEHLITGEVIYVCAHPTERRSLAVPDPMRARIEGFEARRDASGQAAAAAAGASNRGAVAAPCGIVVGGWEALGAPATAVRRAVFVDEQGIPESLELDDMDAQSLHALAFDAAGLAVGTGRLLPDGHVGRMAVLARARGARIGSAILERLVAAAQAGGHASVVLSAQVHAEPFYARHGFIREGDVYDDAGIAHVTMRRAL